ncbi:zinc finger transcription factor YY1-like isoform X2 [Dioscorea cayenensis subsp. rotundata]|uniref:Zinc finger transcription factor YY1-like isoform X2 n=1 Tax=Dioscorea cayennensis subsp. rotundata TaxID=55577 RepID=A0AB40CGF9_DIOCR|nr:zinc finger transcription factor YY1-like isoform X2 [Dioscorea cayenensis subsp. rotundata]
MELNSSHPTYDRRSALRNRAPPVRWFKEWVPQDLAATGGKCSLLKWVTEDTLKALKEKTMEAEQRDLEPEPTTEVLFLCSYEGCGKTFIDAGALRKHAHIHGERQYICTYEGCGRKFLDSSKLKRHYLIHTGERDFVCPHEGCGKAFSLDFNLRAHMKTHSLENYHICPHKECGKKYTHECKLRTHIKMQHEKNTATDVAKHTPPGTKIQSTPKIPASAYGSASSDRPYVCPYEGCGKDYIHEYKLNLHLRREHPGHNSEENGKHTAAAATTDHDMDEASDQDAYIAKPTSVKNSKRKPSAVQKALPTKVANQRGAMTSTPPTTAAPATKKQWPSQPMYEEEDSEETEEEQDNGEEGWRYQEAIGDDEETEDED